jgi:hypothetical protein
MNYIVKQSKERSGYSANKDRKNLVAAWNWSMQYMKPQLSGPYPCAVERMQEIRHPRYVPPEEDVWKVYDAAEGQDQVMMLAYIHLCARRRELFPCGGRMTLTLKTGASAFRHENARTAAWNTTGFR